MSFKVVATPFGRQIETEFPYEHEALRPLGIRISTVDAESDADYIATVKDADAIIAGGRRLTAEIISQLQSCKVIANGGVGVDRVDLDAATAQGIVVTNVPDVFLDEVANHAMMLLLCCTKKTVPLDRCVRENRWRDARQYMVPMPKLTNEVLGLVAFGNIPRRVARRAQGFDMNVIAWDPFVKDDAFEQNGVERVAALNEKKLAGAGLDVMEIEPTEPNNPLHKMDNVVLTPHSASVSDISDVERRRRVGQEIAAVLQGRMPRSVVNREVLDKVKLAEPASV